MNKNNKYYNKATDSKKQLDMFRKIVSEKLYISVQLLFFTSAYTMLVILLKNYHWLFFRIFLASGTLAILLGGVKGILTFRYERYGKRYRDYLKKNKE